MHFKISAVNKQYFWELIKSDGKSIGQAPHVYASLDDAKADIESFKKWAADANVLDPNQPEEHKMGVGQFGGNQHGGGKHPHDHTRTSYPQ